MRPKDPMTALATKLSNAASSPSLSTTAVHFRGTVRLSVLNSHGSPNQKPAETPTKWHVNEVVHATAVKKSQMERMNEKKKIPFFTWDPVGKIFLRFKSEHRRAIAFQCYVTLNPIVRRCRNGGFTRDYLKKKPNEETQMECTISINQSTRRPFSPYIDQPAYQSINQAIKQSNNQSINQQIGHSINQSTLQTH